MLHPPTHKHTFSTKSVGFIATNGSYSWFDPVGRVSGGGGYGDGVHIPLGGIVPPCECSARVSSCYILRYKFETAWSKYPFDIFTHVLDIYYIIYIRISKK